MDEFYSMKDRRWAQFERNTEGFFFFFLHVYISKLLPWIRLPEKLHNQVKIVGLLTYFRFFLKWEYIPFDLSIYTLMQEDQRSKETPPYIPSTCCLFILFVGPSMESYPV